MLKRTLTGACLVAVVVGFFLLRNYVDTRLFHILIAIFCALGTFELMRALGDRAACMPYVMIYGVGVIPAYVLGAVKHGCLEWLRNEKNRLNIRQQIHTTASHSIQARITALEACDPGQLFASEVAAIVQEEIARMPEPMRSIFVASRFDGKTYQEIADTTGISVRNVKAAIQRALGIMREALKDYLPAWLISLLLSEIRF